MYEFTRYSVEYEETGRIYYDYAYQTLDERNKRSFYGESLAVEQQNGQWVVVEVIDLGFLPKSLEADKAYVSEKTEILNQEVFDSLANK